jgi:hypothetical protein
VWLLLAALVGIVGIVAFTMGQSNATPAAPTEPVTEFRAPSETPRDRPAQPSYVPTTSLPATPTPEPPVAPSSSDNATAGRHPPLVRPPGSWPRHPGPTPSPAVSQAAPPAAEDGSEGFLTFDSYPWTQVSENGKSLGTTPIVHVAMAPGPHTLTLENPEQSIKKTYSVTIKSGETVSRRLGIK